MVAALPVKLSNSKDQMNHHHDDDEELNFDEDITEMTHEEAEEEEADDDEEEDEFSAYIDAQIASTSTPSSLVNKPSSSNTTSSSSSSKPESAAVAPSVARKSTASPLNTVPSTKRLALRVMHIVQEKQSTSLSEIITSVIEVANKEREEKFRALASTTPPPPPVASSSSPLTLSPVEGNHASSIKKRVSAIVSVLVAMDVIGKDGLRIYWKPSTGKMPGSIGIQSLFAKERSELIAKIERKKAVISDLLSQQVALRNLAQRNKSRAPPPENRVSLPFIIINTTADAQIVCEVSNDKTNVSFSFDAPFEIHDDAEVLKRMRMDRDVSSKFLNWGERERGEDASDD